MFNNQYMYPQNLSGPQYGQQMQPQYIQQPISKQMSLQGKMVDSLDVVKSTDIPLDGSTSYFPLVDESAIITKKLQSDGTSRIIVYKPSLENKEENKEVIYLTEDDLKDIKSEMKAIKKELKELKGKEEE